MTNMIDLDKRQLESLKKILKEHVPGKQVWAYGSRVKQTAGSLSDLDIAVFDCDSNFIADLKTALEESELLISVDVLSWSDIPENFKINIKKKYVELQSRKKA